METLSDLDNFTASLDIQRVHLSALRLNPNNTQKDHRVNELAESLEIHGQFKPIVVWKGMVMCGNGTFQAARKLGWRYIQCNVLPDDMPQEQAQAIALIDNRTFSDPDEEQIALILQSLPDDLPTGYSDDEYKELIARLGGDEGEGESLDAEPQTSKADELREVWQTETGQLWRLPSRDGKGEHRLIVGDCTDKAVVDRLMGGEEIANLLTDPPYGIDWNTDYTRFGGEYDTANREKYPKIESDNKPFDPRPYMEIKNIVLWGANWYCKHIPHGTWFVWDKRHPSGEAWLSDAELAWFNSGKGVYIYEETVQGAHRAEKAFHPTQKPVGLFSWCIKKAKMEGIIYDPFCGSGTTIIACENLNRYCRAVEISEAYSAVILQRYFDCFQIKGELIP